MNRDCTQAAPIELNRGRLNSIGSRIEDWRLKIPGESFPGNLQSSIRPPIELNRGRLNSIGGRIEDWRFPEKIFQGIFNLQSGPRLSSIGADWTQSGAGLKIEDSRRKCSTKSSIFNPAPDWTQSAPIEFNRARLEFTQPQNGPSASPPLKDLQFSCGGALKHTKMVDPWGGYHKDISSKYYSKKYSKMISKIVFEKLLAINISILRIRFYWNIRVSIIDFLRNLLICS